MNKPLRCLLLTCLTLLGACGAIGNKYDYDDTRVAVGYAGRAQGVAVAAWDQRSYVLNGDKDADFVGLQRNNWGIPFDVATASGQPMAVEMGNTLARTLSGAGFTARAVTVNAHDNAATVHAALLSAKPARTVLLRVDNWESDTLHNPAVFYDLTLSVGDGSGRVLAAKTVKGTDDLEGQFFMPSKKAKQIVPDTFRKKAEALLNAPEIAAALR